MNKRNKHLLSGVFTAAILSGALYCGTANADAGVQMAITPATTVIYMKSNITSGYVTNIIYDANNNPQTIDWTYSGDVYAAVVNPGTGVQSAPLVKIGTVVGNPTFPATFMQLGNPTYGGDPFAVAAGLGTETLPWTCASCTLTISGSTFNKIPNMPLTGRAFIGLGAVANTQNLLALRMGGCAGVQEVSGQGKYANMKGTLCMNGTIGFKPDFSGVGTSNCVLVLQSGPYSSPLTQ